jgi:leucyl aminopeptidase
MRVIIPVLLAPLLATAIPTSKPAFHVQGENRLSDLGGKFESTAGFDLDLSELRLVQFSEDEPPVWITELEKIEAKGKGKKLMDM